MPDAPTRFLTDEEAGVGSPTLLTDEEAGIVPSFPPGSFDTLPTITAEGMEADFQKNLKPSDFLDTTTPGLAGVREMPKVPLTQSQLKPEFDALKSLRSDWYDLNAKARQNIPLALRIAQNPIEAVISPESIASVKKSLSTQAIGLPEFATSPVGAAAGELGALGKVAQKGLALVFAGTTAKDLFKEIVPNLYNNWDKMSWPERFGAATDALGAAGLSVLLAKHGLSGLGTEKPAPAKAVPPIIPPPFSPAVPGQTIKAKPSSETATLPKEAEVTAGENLPAGKVGVGSVETPPVPEAPATIAEQLRLTSDLASARAATLITPGEKLPTLPEGLEKIETKHGWVYYNPDKIGGAGVMQAASGDVFDNTILGGASGAVAKEGTTVVTTSTPAARDVQTEVVETPAEATAAAKAQQKAAPGGTTELKPAAQVLAERTAATPPKPVAPAGELVPQTSQGIHFVKSKADMDRILSEGFSPGAGMGNYVSFYHEGQRPGDFGIGRKHAVIIEFDSSKGGSPKYEGGIEKQNIKSVREATPEEIANWGKAPSGNMPGVQPEGAANPLLVRENAITSKQPAAPAAQPETPNAIPKREAETVPVEVPPGDSGTVEPKVREQGAPEAPPNLPPQEPVEQITFPNGITAHIDPKAERIFYVNKNGERVGHLETSNLADGSIVVENHQLSDEARGTGIGGQAIKRLSELTGKRIISDQYPSAAARSMWDRLGAKRQSVDMGEGETQKRYVLEPKQEPVVTKKPDFSKRAVKMPDAELARRLEVLIAFAEAKKTAGEPVIGEAFDNLVSIYREARKRGIAPKNDFLERIANPPEELPLPKAPVTGADAPAAPKAKEPWEMTFSEYKKAIQERSGPKGQKDTTFLGLSDEQVGQAMKWWEENDRLLGKRTGKEILDDPWGHRVIIQNALREGRPVPPEVLADYPDLQPKAAPAAETGVGSVPIASEMISTVGKSLDAQRARVSNVRFGKPGEILFEYDGKTYSAPEPSDVMPAIDAKGTNAEASRSWALKQILDKKAKPVSATPAAETTGGKVPDAVTVFRAMATGKKSRWVRKDGRWYKATTLTGSIETQKTPIESDIGLAKALDKQVAEPKAWQKTRILQPTPPPPASPGVEMRPGPGDFKGMGGAVPGEFERGGGSPSSARFASIDADRQKRGLEPLFRRESKADQAVMDKAMAVYDRDPSAADRLATEINEKPRSLTDDETMLLQIRRVDLRDQFNRSAREAIQASDDGRMDDVIRANVETERWDKALQNVEQAIGKGGSETGAALRIRRLQTNDDFSLAGLSMDLRKKVGWRKLTDQETRDLQKIADEYKAQAELFEAKYSEEGKARQRAEAELDRIRKGPMVPEFSPSVLNFAEQYAKKWDARGQKAKNELADLLKGEGLLSGPLNPEILDRLAIWGASKIVRGAVDVAKLGDALVRDFSEKLRPFAQAVWDASKKLVDSDLAAETKRLAKPVAEKVKKAIKEGTVETVSTISDKIRNKFAKDEKYDITYYVKKLENLFIEENPRITNEELLNKVHEVMVSVKPDITRIDTWNAITGYGDFKPLSKGIVATVRRQLEGELRELRKIFALEKEGQWIEPSGFERPQPGDVWRRLIKQVYEKKKEYSHLEPSGGESRMQGYLQSRKTFLDNRMKDLRYEIATRERIIKEKKLPPTDAELEAKKAEYEQVKKEHAEVFPKEPRVMTPEERTEASIRMVDREIAKLEKELDSGTLYPRRGTPNIPETPELIEKRAWLQALRDNRDELRAKANPKMSPKERALLNVKRRTSSDIAALENAIATREKIRRKRGSIESDDELDMLREIKAEKKAMYDEVFPKEPITEAERLRRWTERTEKRIAEFEDRIIRGDFSKRTAKPPPTLDPHGLVVKARLETIKRKYMEYAAKKAYEDMTKAQKAWIGVKESLNIPRNVMTSGDLSAVLRQGFFFATGHPIQAARNIATMIRGMASEHNAAVIEQQILHRENAQNGYYSRGKVEFTSTYPLRMTAMEEQVMSKLGQNIPLLGKYLVKPSNRAFTTFLNLARADGFDAMVKFLERKGEPLTNAELRAIGNYVNVSTGRGNMAKFAAASEGLATAFFSPRLVVSRFQLLAGQPMWRGSARTRIAIAGEYGRMLAGMAVIYGLAKLGGATIETDPRSSDFGKLRFGNTRVDPMAGLSQVTVLLSRLISGKTVNAKGKVLPIRGEGVKFGMSNAADIAWRFLRSKFSPVIGAGFDIASGKNVVGETVTPVSVTSNMLVPLSFQDVFNVMKEQGIPAGTAMMILSAFGMGLQYYEPRKKHY